MIVRVESLDDPRLDAYARLTEVQLRSKLEPAQGIFIAESDKVVKRALAGGMEPLSLLMEEKWLPVMQPSSTTWRGVSPMRLRSWPPKANCAS